MDEKIFSQRAVRHAAIALVLIISLVFICTSTVAAIILQDYFKISYDFELSQTEVQGDEVFHATVTGEVTCLETIPVSVSEAELTFRIVAEPQAGGGSVTLNPSYTLTIKPFPDTKGDTFKIDENIPLQFPSGSASGNYDVAAELVEARVKWALGWFDVTGYLPPPPAMGSVTYTAPANNPPDTPSTPSGRDWDGYSEIPYGYSTSATDPDGDQVKYTFDWGDDTTSETGFVDSGTIASESHTWSFTWSELYGITYYIKSKATDSKGASSGWADSKTLTIVPLHGHLNPDFEAFPREGTAPLEIRFENWAEGGERPYVRAEWDFDCDGVFETTLTGTDAEVIADVTWTYPLPGLYTVCLDMTESMPHAQVNTETKIWYITVLFEDPWVYDTNDNGTIEKSEAILAAQHYFGGTITKAQAIEVVTLYFG